MSNETWDGVYSDPEGSVFTGVLDIPITEGLRLWMILAIVLAILLTIMIIACCVMKIRIPRTKREIDVEASGGRQRRLSPPVDLRNYEPPERGCKIVLMTTGPSSNNLLLPPGQDAESASCTTCPTCEHSSINGSRSSLDRQPQQQTQISQQSDL